jgi:sugar phosphate isomerase/epimerase
MALQTSAEEMTIHDVLGRGPGAIASLSVSSWSWHAAYYAGTWSLLDLPAAAAACGITAIECNDFMLPPPRLSRLRRPLISLLPGAPAELWRYSRATIGRLSARAAESGVSVLTWTINSDFSVPARHWPAQQIYLRRGVAAAVRLQSPLLRVNLGGSPDTPRAHDKDIARRLAAFVVDSLRRYPGLAITVENHWGISTDIDRHLQIVDQAAAQLPASLQARFGCCFDPANMPESHERERWWRELALRANHYHLKTTAFGTDEEDKQLPHAALFGLLRRVGYQGQVTIEFSGEGPAEDGVRQSARLFSRYCPSFPQ